MAARVHLFYRSSSIYFSHRPSILQVRLAVLVCRAMLAEDETFRRSSAAEQRAEQTEQRAWGEDAHIAAIPDILFQVFHPAGNPGANLKSMSHRCCLQEVTCEWELTKEIIYALAARNVEAARVGRQCR